MWEHYSSCVSWDVSGMPLFSWRDASVREAKDIHCTGCLQQSKHLRNTANKNTTSSHRLKRRVPRVTRSIVCIIVKSLGKRQDKLLLFFFFFLYSVTISRETTWIIHMQLGEEFSNSWVMWFISRNLLSFSPDCPDSQDIFVHVYLFFLFYSWFSHSNEQSDYSYLRHLMTSVVNLRHAMAWTEMTQNKLQREQVTVKA